jgi:hypothetical protein
MSVNQGGSDELRQKTKKSGGHLSGIVLLCFYRFNHIRLMYCCLSQNCYALFGCIEFASELN